MQYYFLIYVYEMDKSKFWNLPLLERKRILEEQSEKLIEYYNKDIEWKEFLTLDYLENGNED